MSLTEQLLAALSVYGVPLLFGVILIASIGVPLPVTLLLIAAGSFVEMGEMNGPALILTASCGAVIGDQIGYMIGRWGGSRVAARVGGWLVSESKLEQAERAARKWGGASVFFSRWLVTPLGPCVNLSSGISGYSWPRFILWDIAGDVLWVALYVSLGKIFSDRVQAMTEVIGNLTWAIVGAVACIAFGWKLVQYYRKARLRPI
jgi:membrane-associated protein